jgi:hypothetical protein
MSAGVFYHFCQRKQKPSPTVAQDPVTGADMGRSVLRPYEAEARVSKTRRYKGTALG